MYYGKEITEFFKRHNLYNEEMFEYLKEHTDWIDYRDEDNKVGLAFLYFTMNPIMGAFFIYNVAKFLLA